MKTRKQNSKSLPSEYDYLDTLDHDGWRWEFIRRHPSFRSDYESVKDKSEHLYNQEWWDLGEKYSMTKEARNKFSCLDPLRTYPDLPENLKPVFEETVPIKSLHRKTLLKEIRKTLKYWSYSEKDNPIWRLEYDEFILLAVEMNLRPGMFPRNIPCPTGNSTACRWDVQYLRRHPHRHGSGDPRCPIGRPQPAFAGMCGVEIRSASL